MFLDQEVKALTEWKITRKTENQKQPKAATGSHSVALDSLDLNMIVLLMDGIIDEFTINNLSPRFLKVSGITNVPPVEVLGIPYEGNNDPFMELSIKTTAEYRISGGWGITII